MNDSFHLQRFVYAQAGVYEDACRELRRCRKAGHWMWFIFPQLQGLGRSAMSERFGLSGLEEAKAYLEHGTLGPRLHLCTKLVNEVEGRTAEEIFDYPDHLKFRSCITLFLQAAGEGELLEFNLALQKYFDGRPDPLTLKFLRA